MFITKEAFNPIMAAEQREANSQGINETFAHEIAHQYWGTVGQDAEPRGAVADGVVRRVLRRALPEGVQERGHLQARWSSTGGPSAGSGRPTPRRFRWPTRHLDRRATSRPPSFRTAFSTTRAPSLLYTLHKELGDEAFFTFLKSYQKSFAWKFGSTKMVAGLLQYMTKKDYMPFFEKYYWGTEMPKD